MKTPSLITAPTLATATGKLTTQQRIMALLGRSGMTASNLQAITQLHRCTIWRALKRLENAGTIGTRLMDTRSPVYVLAKDASPTETLTQPQLF